MTRLPVFALAFAAIVALALSGCDNDVNGPAPFGRVAGTVTGIETGEPLAGAGLLLVDRTTLAPRSDLIRTTSEGRFDFIRVPVGTYLVFVYTDSLVVFDRTANRITVHAGRTSRHDMRLIESEMWSGRGYRVEGTVRDAVSGEPIAGACVGPTFGASDGTDIWAPIAGIMLPEWGVTDKDGFFSVVSPTAIDELGDLIGLFPISCSAEGYEPHSLIGTRELLGSSAMFLPPPPEGETVLNVEIALQPAGAGATGAVRGRLVFLGNPVADLGVALSLAIVSEPDTLYDDAEKVIVPGRVAVSDQNGEFLIGDLIPGQYYAMPGYLPDDGYDNRHNEDGGGLFEVVAAETTQLGDVEVIRSLVPVAPAAGAEVATGTPVLTWQPLAEAGEYEVWYAENIYFQTSPSISVTDPSYAIPVEDAFAPGSHIRWAVRAYRSLPDTKQRQLIGRFERPIGFTVASER